MITAGVASRWMAIPCGPIELDLGEKLWVAFATLPEHGLPHRTERCLDFGVSDASQPADASGPRTSGGEMHLRSDTLWPDAV